MESSSTASKLIVGLAHIEEELDKCRNLRMVVEKDSLSRSLQDSWPEAWAAILSAEMLVRSASAYLHADPTPLFH